MYFNDGLVGARQADILRQAREQARVHEALLERSGLGETHGALRFFARFVPAFGRRTKVAGEVIEALGAACAQARQWVSLSLDGELADTEQALLVGHLKSCAACTSFQAQSGAATAMLRDAPPERPADSFDLVRAAQQVNGMPAGSEGIA